MFAIWSVISKTFKEKDVRTFEMWPMHVSYVTAYVTKSLNSFLIVKFTLDNCLGCLYIISCHFLTKCNSEQL